MEKNNNISKEYIYPGTVFTAKNYDPFTKKVLSHPFLCIYDQALDEECQGETNCFGLLITSNNKQASRQVPIFRAKNTYLEKDSFCYCNNIYMFLKRDCNVIGQLDSETFFAITKKRATLLRGESDQCVQALMNMKTYEYKLKVKVQEENKKKKEMERAAAIQQQREAANHQRRLAEEERIKKQAAINNANLQNANNTANNPNNANNPQPKPHHRRFGFWGKKNRKPEENKTPNQNPNPAPMNQKPATNNNSRPVNQNQNRQANPAVSNNEGKKEDWLL